MMREGTKMRCLCLLESPARPFHLMIPKHATHLGAPSSVSLPRRRRPKSFKNEEVSTSEQQLGESGRTLLAAVQSKQAAPVPKSQEQGSEEAQISGSDVLRALQRASARKKKMMKNKQQEQQMRRVSSSAATPREKESTLDYSNVRPLSINPNWPTKLDDLEKRLRELSDAI